MSRDISIIPNKGSTASGVYPTISFNGLSASSIKLTVNDDGSVINSGIYGIGTRLDTFGFGIGPTSSLGLSNSSYLHLGAGTSVAGSTPLKLTAGSNVSIPENGSIEYDGFHFYATVAGVRYQLDLSIAGGTGSSFGNNQVIYSNGSGLLSSSSTLTYGGTGNGGGITITNTSGSSTASNYLLIKSETVDNSNYPGIAFQGGTDGTDNSFIQIGNAGKQLNFHAGTYLAKSANMYLDSAAGLIISRITGVTTNIFTIDLNSARTAINPQGLNATALLDILE
jgi:hypothetical protein